ncbi:MAG: hypothetical protein ACYSUY_01055 [Planctomycetota bacterium]|jgi:hypothetical protein
MAKKQTPKRTIVGSPLTPELLKEIGAIDEFPQTPKHFDPHGNWTNTYRIWTCHGFRESGNQNVGFVRFRRVAAGTNEKLSLEVHQEVVEADGMVSVIDTNIRCLNNQLATPVRWHLWSLFIDSDTHPLDELKTEENVIIKQNTMIIETGGKTLKRKVPSRLTSDWCIFEAVQRLKFDKESSLDFNMLEGLSVLKEGQRLSYRRVYPMRIGDPDVRLHCFHQLGRGILPYEYWLDDNHRLLAAISMNKAYILDERAEKTISQRTEQLLKSYRKTKSTVRK